MVDEILELNEAVPKAAEADENAQNINYNLDPINMHKIEESCPHIKELVTRASAGEHVSYPDWRGLCGICAYFGAAGQQRFHELSSKDIKSYRKEDCQRLLDDYKANSHKPTSCEYFACGKDPEKDCGLNPRGGHKQSPIRFGLAKGEKIYDSLDIKPPSVHLIDIEDTKYTKKVVSTQVMVAATGSTFHIPRSYLVRCIGQAQSNELCGSCSYKNGVTREISPIDTILIEFCNISKDQMMAILAKRAKSSVQESCELNIKIVEHYAVQELVVVPKAFMIREKSDGSVVDETGRDYRHKLIYYAGSLKETEGYFEAEGLVTPNPKNQLVTLLASRMASLSTDVTAFEITKEIKQEFKKLQVTQSGIEGIEDKMTEILKDVTHNITRIYGEDREIVLLFVLLTMHSVLRFAFDGAPINKGWIEILIIGDTGQGKSQMLEKLIESIGLGQSITGSTATRTGLAYSLDTVESNKRFLRWGALPMNDGRFLIIDEAQKIPEAQIEELSSCRSSGLLKVERSIKGEHKTRVRLIFLANPVTGEPMSAHTHGIQAAKFQRPADIRRLDVIICVSKGDVDADTEIYKLKAERDKVEHIITGGLLKQSILWAWTRKPDDVIFEPEASAEIIDQAKVLSKKYETADIPLVSTDIHEKLARLSVAMAALVHSTDESHTKVIVRPEHVQFISQKLQDVYDHKNCWLDKYAASMRTGSELTEIDYVQICNEIKEMQGSESYHGAMSRLLQLILNSETLSNSEITTRLDIGTKAVRERLRILLNHDLVISTSKGYKKTNKGVIFFRRYFEETNKNSQDAGDAKDRGSEHIPEDESTSEGTEDAGDIG